MRTDEELIVAHTTNGCRVSLDELVGRHLPKIRALIQQMVVYDVLTDDVTQDVFIQVARHLPTIDVKSNFKMWLYRVAMNTTHSHIERHQRLRMEAIGGIRGVEKVPVDSADKNGMKHDQRNEISAALAQLSPKLRAAIVLTMLHQKEIREAAYIEDCTTVTMYLRVFFARRYLQKRLAKHLAP